MDESDLANLPKQVSDYYQKGLEAVKRENFGYAIELFSSALALKQDFAEARFYLWLSLWEQQRHHPNIIKLVTGKIFGFITMMGGFSLQKAGKTWEAIYQFEKAMKADPGNAAILNAIADCFLSEGQTLNAIKILEGVPMINNNDSKTLKKLAGLYKGMENYEKARAFYKAALQANPGDMDAEHGIKELDAIKTLIKGSFDQ
ncbi:MAG: tetratricopeptide repeat protein [Candidatus Omnitrophota bacterium]|jgi:thioredoxin-like negative regulator of GroEL